MQCSAMQCNVLVCYLCYVLKYDMCCLFGIQMWLSAHVFEWHLDLKGMCLICVHVCAWYVYGTCMRCVRTVTICMYDYVYDDMCNGFIWYLNDLCRNLCVNDLFVYSLWLVCVCLIHAACVFVRLWVCRMWLLVWCVTDWWLMCVLSLSMYIWVYLIFCHRPRPCHITLGL